MTVLPEGFGFESPDALRALLGIPLLLLLVLLRRRAVPLVVPWLPLWEKALGDATRRASPMRWIVSLLVKALLLAAAILAWAHPRTEKGARLVQPTLVVVDASAGLSSATESGTLAAATEAAARSVAARAEADGPVLRTAWSPDGTAPSGGLFAADVPREAAWVRRAAALEPGARVVLVTPFATAGTLPDGVHVAGVGNGRLPPVGGIREVTPSPGGVGVRVEGTGRSLRLVDGARVVAERAVPESGEVVMPLDGAPLDRPRLELHPPDAWPDDDVAWLDAAVPTRLKVLVVARGPTPALDAALAASGYVASEGSGRVAPEGLPSDLGPWDVVVFVGGRVPADLPPGDYVAFAADLPPWAGRSDAAGPESARTVSPGFSGLEGFDPREWTSSVARAWTPPPGAEVWVAGGRGGMLGRVSDGGRRLSVVAVPPVSDGGTLTRLAAFPVMVRALLGRVPRLGERPEAVTRRVGAALVGGGETAPALATLDGAAVALRRGPDGGWRLPGVPGHYRLDGRVIGISVLDAPGRPLDRAPEPTPWPEPPPTSERESHRWICLLALLVLLLVDAWLGEVWPPR